MDLQPISTTVTSLEDRSWLGSAHGTESTRSVTLDLALFTEATHYPNGEILSGTVLAKKTSTGLYGPYSGTTEEVQTVTEGGSGLTSFTLTYAGQTTGAIAAGATAAVVQAALEALSNLAPGDVVVTGSAGGPFTVTFGGTLANTNVAAMTATPTGGSGTVTVATLTAGGADGSTNGLEVAKGYLFNTIPVKHPAGKAGAPLLTHGAVRVANLPVNSGYDPAVLADLPLILHV